MPRKLQRKASAEQSLPAKSSKRRKAKSEAKPAVEKDRVWKCEVLSESKNGDLLCHWWPDSETGESWDRSWIAREYAEEGLLKDWNVWKRDHPGQRSRSEGSIERLIERGPQSPVPSSSEVRNSVDVQDESSGQSQPNSSLRQQSPIRSSSELLNSGNVKDESSGQSQPLLIARQQRQDIRVRKSRTVISSSDEEIASDISIQGVPTPRNYRPVSVIIRAEPRPLEGSIYDSTKISENNASTDRNSQSSNLPLSGRVVIDSQGLGEAESSNQKSIESITDSSQPLQRQSSGEPSPVIPRSDHFEQGEAAAIQHFVPHPNQDSGSPATAATNTQSRGRLSQDSEVPATFDGPHSPALKYSPRATSTRPSPTQDSVKPPSKGRQRSNSLPRAANPEVISISSDQSSSEDSDQSSVSGGTEARVAVEQTSQAPASEEIVSGHSAGITLDDSASNIEASPSLGANSADESPVYLRIPLYSPTQTQRIIENPPNRNEQSSTNLRLSQLQTQVLKSTPISQKESHSPAPVGNTEALSTGLQQSNPPGTRDTFTGQALRGQGIDANLQTRIIIKPDFPESGCSDPTNISQLTKSGPTQVHDQRPARSPTPSTQTSSNLVSFKPPGSQQNTISQEPAPSGLNSSSLPQAPSYSLQEAQESKMPSRPQTPTPVSSASISSSAKLTFSERRKLARQQRDQKLAVGIAERAASNAATQSELDARPATDAMPKIESTDASIMSYGEKNNQQTISGGVAAIQDDIGRESWDLILPLPLPDLCFDSYNSSFQYHYQEGGILNQLWNHDDLHPPLGLLRDAQNLLHKMCRHMLHLDLIDDQQPVSQYPTEAFTEYAISISSKFAFLGSLLRTAREATKHIVIIAEDERPLHTVDQFLRDCAVTYACPGLQSASDRGSQLRITLLGSSTLSQCDLDQPIQHDPPDLIIGIDHSFNFASNLVRILRSVRKTPVMQLMIPFSMEHVVAHKRSEWTLYDLKHSFSLAAQIRQTAGKTAKGKENVDELGQQVATMLVSNLESCDALPTIDSYPLPNLSAQKRTADQQIDSYRSPKRAKEDIRMSEKEPAEEFHSETFRVTDSTAQKGSGTDQVPETAAPAPILVHTSEAQYREKIESLETVIRTLEPENHELWIERNTLRKQLASQEYLNARISKLELSITTEKEKVASLQVDLAKANGLVAGSEKPELQQYHELQELKKETASRTKKLASVEENRDMMMKMYSDMRNTADALQMEKAELIDERDKLLVKASGEAARLRQSFNDDALARMRDKIAKLEAQHQADQRALAKQADDAANLREEKERLQARLGAASATRGSVRANSPAGSTLGVPGQGRSSRAGTPLGHAATPAGSRIVSRQSTPQPNASTPKPKGFTISFSSPHRTLLRE